MDDQVTAADRNAMQAAFARWLRRSRDFTEADTALAEVAWHSAWLECRRWLERERGSGMSPEQYDRLRQDVRELRDALGLPTGALDMTPRAAFRECIDAARAVRLDERRRIVAWLRRASAADVAWAAAEIERGLHTAEEVSP